MGRFSVDEVVLAWHRLRRQWRLHRTLYEYLGKVRAKLPDKHQWAEVISRGPDPPADSSRGADAPVSHSELERLMQVVLQDTTPDDVFSVSCLRTNWKNRRGDVFKGKLADKLGKAFQKLLDGALLAKTEKPEKITRDSTMYSTFQGFLRCKLRLVDEFSQYRHSLAKSNIQITMMCECKLQSRVYFDMCEKLARMQDSCRLAFIGRGARHRSALSASLGVARPSSASLGAKDFTTSLPTHSKIACHLWKARNPIGRVKPDPIPKHQ